MILKSNTPKEQYAERIALVNDAIELKETWRVPVVPYFSSLPQRICGSSYRDIYYDYDKAGQAAIDFFTKYPCDAAIYPNFTSGKSNEIAQSSMIDWPGRPGTKVSDYSSHQVIEHEYIDAEEYRELIDDFTGFILRKYIPRAFPGLKGLETLSFNPNVVLSTGFLKTLTSPVAAEAYGKLMEIGRLDAEAAAKTAEYRAKVAELGFPAFFSGIGQVPFDVIGDYFRGTLAILTDQLYYEDEILELCDIIADIQIKSWEYLKNPNMPVRRVFFPLHKGMDGFMSPDQYERLYWKPYKKMLNALFDMGVTPYIFTEGKYNSRLEQLCDLPKGKAIVHFEDVDMKRAKETVGQVACISGNLPLYLLEFGTPEQVSDYCKYLIDTCAPGGGYIFDANGCIENATVANLEAMFETVYTYGRK